MHLRTPSRFDETLENLASAVVDCAFQVHKNMRAGLLERVYEECFAIELEERNIPFERQKQFPLAYKNKPLSLDHRIDLVIDNKIIVELKAVDRIIDVHKSQILSYMHLSNIGLGFLINFNVPLIKNGIQRIVL